MFDVDKGLKNSTEIQLPNGTIMKIGIDYERIHKRCFLCQRLTHDKQNCPFLPANLSTSLPDNPSTHSIIPAKGKDVILSDEVLCNDKVPSTKLLVDSIKAYPNHPTPSSINLISDKEIKGTFFLVSLLILVRVVWMRLLLLF